MKAKHLLLLGAVCMLLAPGLAMASVVGSAHDLVTFYTYTGAAAKQGTCSFCHVPHKAGSGGERLFPASPSFPTTAGLTTWNTDTLSAMCWYCHGAASTYLSAREVNPFANTSHLRDATKLTAGNLNTLKTGDPQDVSALPTDLDLTANSLRCVSCHNIHDNSKKPFLRWGTNGDFSAQGPTATPVGFCGKCHTNRHGTTMGTANANGMHPAKSGMLESTTGSPILAWQGITSRPMVNLTLAGSGVWDLGGHPLYTTAGASQNSFVCGTCHVVHANETSNFSAGDGATQVTAPVAPAGSPLLIDTITVAAGATGVEALCVECHSIVAGVDVRGPGAIGTISHPIGTQTTLAQAIYGAGRGYKWGGTASGVIQCESCHDLHWSAQNNSTTYDQLGYILAYQCEGCHLAAGVALQHHPVTAVNEVVGTDVFSNNTTATIDWITRARTADATVTYGFPGPMGCGTCHGRGSAGAHNNPSSVGFPGLTGPNDQSQMCIDCHSFNPSTYSQHTTTGLGTHYVGTVTTLAYKKTTPWVGSGATSKWGTGGANGAVICESCHTLKINGRNGHVMTWQSANNSLDTDGTTLATIGLMVRNSGNSQTLAAATDYMCTTCHGTSPGGSAGNTGAHPVLPAMTSNAGTIASPVPTSYTTGHTAGAAMRLNCESCHRPHDASTASGTDFVNRNFILESAGTGNGYINTSPLCQVCHTGY